MYQMGIMTTGLFFPPSYHLADTQRQRLEVTICNVGLFQLPTLTALALTDPRPEQ